MRLASIVAVAALMVGSAASAQDWVRYANVRVFGDAVWTVEQAPSNVRLVFQLIEADGAPGGAVMSLSVREDTSGARLRTVQRVDTSVDASIEPIVAELRKIFRFERYQLVSTSMLNVIAPTAEEASSGRQHLTDDQGRPYDLEVYLMPADGNLRLHVELTGSTFSAPLPPDGTSVRQVAKLISASVNLQPDKSVVLGSTRLDGTPGALILVVTATYDP